MKEIFQKLPELQDFEYYHPYWYNVISFKQKVINDVNIWAASWQNQQSGMRPSEDSDRPGHPPGLIGVFAVHSVGS